MWGSLTPDAPHKLPILTLQGEQQWANTSSHPVSVYSRMSPVVTLDSHIRILQSIKKEQTDCGFCSS